MNNESKKAIPTGVGAPEPNEIEITPAMIEAGASVLAGYDRIEMSETYAEILAERIIKAALSVSLHEEAV